MEPLRLDRRCTPIQNNVKEEARQHPVPTEDIDAASEIRIAGKTSGSVVVDTPANDVYKNGSTASQIEM